MISSILISSSCRALILSIIYRDADKSLARPGRKQARNHVRDARFPQHRDASCNQVFFRPARQGAEEIHTILTETLAFFLPGRAKDLSAPLYKQPTKCTSMSMT